MNILNFEKRIVALQSILSAKGNDLCCCRANDETKFHSAADLIEIMKVSCSAHKFRDLGDLWHVVPGMPLLAEDCSLCSCPPRPTRDWLESKRGPLTEAEQREECDSWELELTVDAKEKQRVEEVQIELLLRTYFTKRRRYHAKLPG